MNAGFLPRAGALALALCTSIGALADSGRCEARSASQQVRLIELYTSEGCNSCPPADRWLSKLKGRDDVLAAAFHVDYWDHLGWRDRFGAAAYTERQAQRVAAGAARFAYTPQVLVDGRDWRRWPQLPPSGGAARVSIGLRRDEARVIVDVAALPGAPSTIAAWWAVLEDGHASAVKAGENQGVTLQHDHVVRAYGQRAAWSSAAPARFEIAAPRLGEGGRPARVLVVVADARNGLPLQAVQLGC
jgi:hypothetical protein